MKIVELSLYTNLSTGENPLNYPDFKLGNIRLARHLGVSDDHGILVADRKFARQLLLKEKPELENSRVPLYVCCCCHELGCGAVTVEVSRQADYFVWKDLGYENGWEGGFSQSDYMKRTGPFMFEAENYISVIRAYCR